MKATAGPLAVLLVSVSLFAGCASDDPPTLESYEFWDGTPDVSGAQRLAIGADGSLALAPGRHYTARAYLRTAGRTDRCIYRVFSHNWRLPTREFFCWPETSKRLIVDEDIGASVADLARVSDHQITISVAEYDIAARTELNRYTPYTIPVVIRP